MKIKHFACSVRDRWRLILFQKFRTDTIVCFNFLQKEFFLLNIIQVTIQLGFDALSCRRDGGRIPAVVN